MNTLILILPKLSCKQSKRPNFLGLEFAKTHVTMNCFVASINITPKDREHFFINVSTSVDPAIRREET
jgi:hypothetical protein